MPSKYGKQYMVPKEFPSVLKSFTREVLRAQPSDIYEFGAQYFTELLAQAEAAQAAENAAPKRLSPLELEQLLTQMFAEADTDGSGALDKNEFKVRRTRCIPDFGGKRAATRCCCVVKPTLPSPLALMRRRDSLAHRTCSQCATSASPIRRSGA